MQRVLLGAAILFAAGCTAVSVQPLAEKPAHMCIKRNPKVIINDFVPVLQAGLRRHGIESTLYDAVPVTCSHVLEYTARRSWDFGPYLSTADLHIRGPQRRQVASAHYHLRGKGGLSLMKWAGVASKMDPVIDELLASANMIPSQAPPAPIPSSTASTESKSQQLEELQSSGLSYEEYQRRYREIMGQ